MRSETVPAFQSTLRSGTPAAAARCAMTRLHRSIEYPAGSRLSLTNENGSESPEYTTAICFVALSFASVSRAGAAAAGEGACATDGVANAAAASAVAARMAERRRFTLIDLCGNRRRRRRGPAAILQSRIALRHAPPRAHDRDGGAC